MATSAHESHIEHRKLRERVRALDELIPQLTSSDRLRGLVEVARLPQPTFEGVVRLAGHLAAVGERGPRVVDEIDAAFRPLTTQRKLRKLDELLDAVDEGDAEAEATFEVLPVRLEELAAELRALDDSLEANEAARLLGRSRQAIESARRRGRLLALRDRNRWRYPRRQFDRNSPNGVLPGIPEVLEAFDRMPLATLTWLAQPREELGGRTPFELLEEGRSQSVVELARNDSFTP